MTSQFIARYEPATSPDFPWRVYNADGKWLRGLLSLNRVLCAKFGLEQVSPAIDKESFWQYQTVQRVAVQGRLV